MGAPHFYLVSILLLNMAGGNKKAAAQEVAAKEVAAKEAAMREVAAKEIAAKKEAVAKEVAAKESAAKVIAVKEAAAKEEAAVKEIAAKEAAAKEVAAKEAAAKELAAKEKVTKETTAKAVDKGVAKEGDCNGSEFVKPKVVEKVFHLPLVTDTYDALAKLSTPLQPYVEKAGSIASPVVDCAFTIKDDIEGKMPEVFQSGLSSAKGQVVAAAASVDASLCSGFDSLADKVPALKETTPALINSTKEGVSTYATQAATYVASFNLAHVILKASDLCFETADGILKWTSSEKVEPVMMGLCKVRSEVTTVRKEGVVLNGTEKAKVLEDSSLIWAMVEMAGLASYFSHFVFKGEEDAMIVTKDAVKA